MNFRHAARPFFGEDVTLVGERILAVVKRGAVDGVHGRNAETARREASENTGLRAVGVDDLGPYLSQQRDQLAVAAPVTPGMDAPSKFGNDPQVEAAALGPLDQRSLRTESRAGDEASPHRHTAGADLRPSAECSLAPADDQPRDEMHDAKCHVRASSYSTRTK